jgi:hypothetical protein
MVVGQLHHTPAGAERGVCRLFLPTQADLHEHPDRVQHDIERNAGIRIVHAEDAAVGPAVRLVTDAQQFDVEPAERRILQLARRTVAHIEGTLLVPADTEVGEKPEANGEQDTEQKPGVQKATPFAGGPRSAGGSG